MKLLFVVNSMDVGGVQSGIMAFGELMPPHIEVDVLNLTSKIGFHEKDFSQYGKVYHINTQEGNNRFTKTFSLFLNNIIIKKKFNEFLHNNHYDVVHSKSMAYSATIMKVAKEHNIPCRVAQAHVDKPNHLSPIHKLYYKKCSEIIEECATHKLAVSEKAANLMFGDYGGSVIKNPTISLKKFDHSKYPTSPHKGINLVQIGTYSKRKNQCFSLLILKELLNKGFEARLVFVGYTFDDTHYFDEVRKLAEKEALSQNVIFLPKETEVAEVLAESDYMLLPSLREGLPNVALEAQAMGVPVFLTDNIFKNTDCGLCVFLPLEKGPLFWAEEIVKYREEKGTEKVYPDMTEWDNENVIKEYVKIWESRS